MKRTCGVHKRKRSSPRIDGRTETTKGFLFLNCGVTILGMVARYLLEYGEVSNTYNFTIKNIVVHIVIMMLLSMIFWIQAKKQPEEHIS